MTTAPRHLIVNPPDLPPAVGFAHAVVAAPGRLVFLGGQVAQDANGRVVGETISEQFDLAAANVVRALGAAGGRPEHLVQMLIYVTDLAAYHDRLEDLGTIYRRHFGRHYVASALFEVKSLFVAAALVELVCLAVVPAGAKTPGPPG